MRLSFLLTLFCAASLIFAQTIPQGNQTPTWEETIAFYKELATKHRHAELQVIGEDDNGSPIHLFVISDGSGFNPVDIRQVGKSVLLINNAIHPGEPCGVNASMRLAKKLLEDDRLIGLTTKTAVCIVPMYNVSGAQRRGCCSRANQNGPKEYGFRGNARNLDLNRDFIKMDSKNAHALTRALREWDPDVFMDTHTTDGSDHQYAMQLLAAQDDRLDPALKGFMNNVFKPALYKWMDNKKIKMCPYFSSKNDVPDNGITGFDDSPRYSTGYSTLFNMFGFVSEAHMLKPFEDRVEATYQLQLAILDVMNTKQAELMTARKKAKANTASQAKFKMNHVLDHKDSLMIPFAAVKHSYYKSPVTGAQVYRYFNEDLIDIEVAWFDRFVPEVEVERPRGYIIPQEWHEIIAKLNWNMIPMQTLDKDSVVMVEAYRIGKMETRKRSYEGHYVHYDIEVDKERMAVQFRKGDALVLLGSETDRFVVETLEPHSQDSYFAWGFFDSILQQKEWFSGYVFEAKAKRMLEDDPALKAEFEKKKSTEKDFAENSWGQLYWLYTRSPNYEQTARLYPVYRIPLN